VPPIFQVQILVKWRLERCPIHGLCALTLRMHLVRHHHLGPPSCNLAINARPIQGVGAISKVPVISCSAISHFLKSGAIFGLQMTSPPLARSDFRRCPFRVIQTSLLSLNELYDQEIQSIEMDWTGCVPTKSFTCPTGITLNNCLKHRKRTLV